MATDSTGVSGGARRRLPTLAAMLGVSMAFGMLAGAPIDAAAGERDGAMRRAQERKAFTDAEIIKGFFRTAFGAEFRFAGATDRIRKYDAPVRVYVDSRAVPDRRDEIASIVADINARIQHLDIAVTPRQEDANVTALLVRERDLRRTIRRTYGHERARQIQKNLEPQCLSSFQKDETFRIRQSEVILVVDASDFVFRDCAYEELLQSLGPINDTDIPWTMFNDNVQMGFFGIFDQYILNILYHPRIRPGMTADEVSGLLPQILPKVRSFVAQTNNLQPRD